MLFLAPVCGGPCKKSPSVFIPFCGPPPILENFRISVPKVGGNCMYGCVVKSDPQKQDLFHDEFTERPICNVKVGDPASALEFHQLM